MPEMFCVLIQVVGKQVYSHVKTHQPCAFKISTPHWACAIPPFKRESKQQIEGLGEIEERAGLGRKKEKLRAPSTLAILMFPPLTKATPLRCS